MWGGGLDGENKGGRAACRGHFLYYLAGVPDAGDRRRPGVGWSSPEAGVRSSRQREGGSRARPGKMRAPRDSLPSQHDKTLSICNLDCSDGGLQPCLRVQCQKNSQAAKESIQVRGSEGVSKSNLGVSRRPLLSTLGPSLSCRLLAFLLSLGEPSAQPSSRPRGGGKGEAKLCFD